MRIIVTGGAGFIGSNFLNLFVPRFPEHQFINVDRLTYAANPASVAAASAAANYAFERIDIADQPAVEALFDRVQPDLVIHFAAESHVDRSIHGPGAFVHTNVVGTHQLLEVVRSLPHIHLHHVSTDEVYGSLGPTGAFVETSPYAPSSPYAASKAAADHLVRAYAHTYDLSTTISNCSNNYGPYQFPEKLLPLMLLNMLDGEPLPVYGDGTNVRDWLYVDDHAEALWRIVTAAERGSTYNIGGGAERTNLDLLHQLIDVVAELTDRDAAALRSLITFVADRPGHDQRYAIDCSKLERDLGFQPSRDLDQGLRDTVRWYLDHRDWVDKARSGGYQEWIANNYERRTR
jgi:dTDP-glucose 4,6-dehydratase